MKNWRITLEVEQKICKIAYDLLIVRLFNVHFVTIKNKQVVIQYK